MSKVMDEVRAGDTVTVYFLDQPPKVFTIYRKFDGELFLTEPQKIYGSLKYEIKESVVVATTIRFNGVQLSTGDKIILTTQDGHKLEYYISYLFGNHGVALSHKKIPAKNSCNWTA